MQNDVNVNAEEIIQSEVQEIGIHTTPDEILVEIFGHADNPLPISQVCQRFRGISLDVSNLWSTPPFRPNQLTELFLSRSKNSPLNVKVEKCDFRRPTADRTCNCASHECTCAQRAYITSVLPHRERWYTLDVEKVSPKLCDFLLTTIAGIALTSIQPMPNRLPALYKAKIPTYAIQILDMINPDLTELEYNSWERDVPPPYNSWTRGQPWTFADLMRRIERFTKLQKLNLDLHRINLDDVTPANAIQLPSLKSLTIGARHILDNVVLSHVLHLVRAQNLSFLKVKIYRGRFQSLHSDNMFWNEVSMMQNLTSLTIDDTLNTKLIGPKAIVTKVLAHCLHLVKLTVICRYPNDHFNNTTDNDSISNETWQIQSPLKELHLLDCHTYPEELTYIGDNLRLGANWDNFEKIVLRKNPGRPVWRTIVGSTIQNEVNQDFPCPELGEFLRHFKEQMEGKVEWEL